ncbi:hypothetical protein BSKO_09944 [Bryopsis sp. KO-2023]|nr:hypothetical protein BSKO_09944 [Bryopsis sp. KO-2023]
MYVARTAKRFSFLLLDEGEDYLQEYICVCRWPNEVAGNWNGQSDVHGTLRVCSKSLFFEADDIRIPVVRLPLAKVESLEPTGGKSFTVTTSMVTKMKANNQDHPYVFEKSPNPRQWGFMLPNRSIDELISIATEQMLLKDAGDMLQQQAQERQNKFQFDTSRLVKRFSEKIEREVPVTQLTPLVREPGKLVITSLRVYFQPLNNVSGTTLVLTHPLSAVAAVARRRFSLRPIGLEVFFYDPTTTGENTEASSSEHLWDAPSAFFVFRSVEAREQVAALLLNHVGSEKTGGAILEVKGRWLMKVTRAWQLGRISNFDYLLYLNLAAGRSFNDLTQWPVFPWILADYYSKELDLDNPASFRDLSKPVGALNPERLEMFRFRYKEMPFGDGMPPRFLYGTHYSTPGYVMFWLLRSAPGRVLQLQNGKFDAPDRLFCSVAKTWESVTSNAADVKELIPEFFLPNGDFLINKFSLALGKRQSGKPVGDVELPPWADSPSDFLSKHRAALESPHVSANLHHWIDLIFGHKQRGEKAVEADNLFYYLSYEGGVDIEQVTDPLERRALESQINEFGQTPMQLFSQPHPPRRVCPKTPDPALVFHIGPATNKGSSRDLKTAPSKASYDTSSQALSVALLSAVMSAASSDSIDAFDDAVGTCQPLAPPVEYVPEQQEETNNGAEEQQQPSTAGPYAAVLQQWSFLDRTPGLPRSQSAREAGARVQVQELRASVSKGMKGLNSRFNALAGKFKGMVPSGSSNSFTSSSGGDRLRWSDWMPHKLNQKYSFKFPHGGINAVAVSNAGDGTLYCAGHNATLRLWSLESGMQMRSARLEANVGAGLPLSSISLLPSSSDQSGQPLVLVGSYDNAIYAYSAEAGRLVGHFMAHDNAVSDVKLVGPGCQKLATASWDCSVKIWSLSEGRHPWESAPLFPVVEIADHESGVWAMDFSNDGNVVVTGTDEGDISAWDLRTPQSAIWRAKHTSDYIGGLAFTPDQSQIVVASADGQMSLLSMADGGKPLISASCGVPLRCCKTDGVLCVGGGDDGKLYIWNVGQQLGTVRGKPDDPVPEPDGLYKPLECCSGSAVNSLVVQGVGVGEASQLMVVTGHDEGEIMVYHGASEQDTLRS